MKKKTPRIVIIAVLSLITVLIWFGSEVFRNLSKTPETKVEDAVLIPLNPTLDEEALNKLESSLFFDTSQLPLPVASQTPEETSFETIAPEPSPNTTPLPTSSP